MKDGLCFVAHEVFLQHFNSNGYFTFLIDIKKVPRRNVKDLNTISSASCVNNRTEISTNSLYDNLLLYENENNSNRDDDNRNNPPVLAIDTKPTKLKTN